MKTETGYTKEQRKKEFIEAWEDHIRTLNRLRHSSNSGKSNNQINKLIKEGMELIEQIIKERFLPEDNLEQARRDQPL